MSDQIFKCVCCKEDAPASEASLDSQCGGDVCDHCRRLFIKALAYLKHEGIDRPFVSSDINHFNTNRIKNYY